MYVHILNYVRILRSLYERTYTLITLLRCKKVTQVPEDVQLCFRIRQEQFPVMNRVSTRAHTLYSAVQADQMNFHTISAIWG